MVVVIGGGPAGLMAAEVLSQAGQRVALYDAMPSVGRKFLLAGKGGLNLTHAEPLPAFITRYGSRQQNVAAWLDAWSPNDLRDWAHGLGIDTFVGSSDRVFPHEMKAAPLLRAWLHRLRQQGVEFHSRHRWVGWNDQATSCADDQSVMSLQFEHGTERVVVEARAVILALGGASWPQLGSDGQWVPLLNQLGKNDDPLVAPLQPANCGFHVAWSDYFRDRFAGHPMKSVVLRFGDQFERAGEFMITQHGVEGSLIYAASAWLRESLNQAGQATFTLDLVPGRNLDRLTNDLSKGRGTRSVVNALKEATGLTGAKAALLRERYSNDEISQLMAHSPAVLAQELKAWPITVTSTRPVAEAISTAGGIRLEALTSQLMLQDRPGVFCAGEMLDWEAPTGGYLLTGCLASGRVAAQGVLNWLQ